MRRDAERPTVTLTLSCFHTGSPYTFLLHPNPPRPRCCCCCNCCPRRCCCCRCFPRRCCCRCFPRTHADNAPRIRSNIASIPLSVSQVPQRTTFLRFIHTCYLPASYPLYLFGNTTNQLYPRPSSLYAATSARCRASRGRRARGLFLPHRGFRATRTPDRVTRVPRPACARPRVALEPLEPPRSRPPCPAHPSREPPGRLS